MPIDPFIEHKTHIKANAIISLTTLIGDHVGTRLSKVT
jgi:hypothetical protein